MKLADELKANQKELTTVNWPATVVGLTKLARSGGKYHGALLIGVYSQQGEGLLAEWAKKEGFEFIAGPGGFGVKDYWLVWDRQPTLSAGADASILPNGTLRLE